MPLYPPHGDSTGRRAMARYSRRDAGIRFPITEMDGYGRQVKIRQAERMARMIGKVLTLEEIHALCLNELDPQAREYVDLIVPSHEALRAERATARKEAEVYQWAVGVKDKQLMEFWDYLMEMEDKLTHLRGLIEGMGHEAGCNSKLGKLARAVLERDDNCNCILSKVNL